MHNIINELHREWLRKIRIKKLKKNKDVNHLCVNSSKICYHYFN